MSGSPQTTLGMKGEINQKLNGLRMINISSHCVLCETAAVARGQNHTPTIYHLYISQSNWCGVPILGWVNPFNHFENILVVLFEYIREIQDSLQWDQEGSLIFGKFPALCSSFKLSETLTTNFLIYDY